MDLYSFYALMDYWAKLQSQKVTLIATLNINLNLSLNLNPALNNCHSRPRQRAKAVRSGSPRTGKHLTS